MKIRLHGTAAGPLAGYPEQLGYINKNENFLILQGEQVEHPSIIRLRVIDDAILVGSSSVIVVKGEIYL